MARLQTVFFCSLFLLSGICARASTIFNVDISSYSTNYCCWGTPESTPLEAGVSITFTNSLSQTDVFTLTDGVTVRDYHNNDDGGDTLTGTGTGVTAVTWWNNGITDDNVDMSVEPDQRLDAQTFVLPSDWAGTTLTSMEIQYAGTNSDDAVLSAFQIAALGGSSSVPEPSTLALGVASLATLGAFARRRKA